jgi:hypothetical protein
MMAPPNVELWAGLPREAFVTQMRDHDDRESVLHATFTLERKHPVPPERDFAAWADAAARARWFAGPGSDYELDFRAGGRETVTRAGAPGAPIRVGVSRHRPGRADRLDGSYVEPDC